MKLKIIIKNTTNIGMERREQMLTERLKRVFSQQASGIDYAILLAPLPVITTIPLLSTYESCDE